MKIKEIVSQTRRDFVAVYSCEHCGHGVKGSGYDDDYFHREVVPGMECTQCKKTSPEDYRPMVTKYAADEVV